MKAPGRRRHLAFRSDKMFLIIYYCGTFLNLLFHIIDPMPFCSHLRAIELFEEAITSDCHMYAHQFCVDESNIPVRIVLEIKPKLT